RARPYSGRRPVSTARPVDSVDKNEVGTRGRLGKMGPPDHEPPVTPMAGSVNKVILVGNLGRDPEIRSTQEGMRIANLNLATSESWRDRVSGERKERTEWHRVVIFNERLVELAQKYLRKGSKIYLEGALQTRKWTDQNGLDRYTTEVVLQRFRGELTMLDGAGGGRSAEPSGD